MYDYFSYNSCLSERELGVVFLFMYDYFSYNSCLSERELGVVFLFMYDYFSSHENLRKFGASKFPILILCHQESNYACMSLLSEVQFFTHFGQF